MWTFWRDLNRYNPSKARKKWRYDGSENDCDCGDVEVGSDGDNSLEEEKSNEFDGDETVENVVNWEDIEE